MFIDARVSIVEREDGDGQGRIHPFFFFFFFFFWRFLDQVVEMEDEVGREVCYEDRWGGVSRSWISKCGKFEG